MHFAQRKQSESRHRYTRIYGHRQPSPYGCLCWSSNPRRYSTGTHITLPYEPYYTVTVHSPNVTYPRNRREDSRARQVHNPYDIICHRPAFLLGPLCKGVGPTLAHSLSAGSCHLSAPTTALSTCAFPPFPAIHLIPYSRLSLLFSRFAVTLNSCLFPS